MAALWRTNLLLPGGTLTDASLAGGAFILKDA